MLKQAINSLPDFFKERTHILREGSINSGNLLYVMHNCLRYHDNPALDTARFLAKYYKLKLHVVSVFTHTEETTERQLSFVLDAVKCLQQRQEFLYTYFIQEEETVGELLKRLCQGNGTPAAMLVFDGFHTDIQKIWMRSSHCPVVSVSSNLLYPKVQDCNSFGFFLRQIRTHYPEHCTYPDVSSAAFMSPSLSKPTAKKLPFKTSDLNIDHRISLLAHRRGGEMQALKLWEDIQDQIFLKYPKLRRRLFDETGISLLPYLNHGMISPFKVLNDCYLAGTDSASLFKTQFLLWYEYLYSNYLTGLSNRHSKTVTSPKLRQMLETASTDSNALNACIQDAQNHGLLLPHVLMQAQKEISCSNLKQHWSKISTFLREWTLTTFQMPLCPQAGNDAGQTSEALKKPILPVIKHKFRKKIGVIGAGMAGLIAARSLQQSGYSVEIFEEKPQAGGRLFFHELNDHFIAAGVPFFTANHISFRREIAAWEALGHATLWNPDVMIENLQNGISFNRPPHIMQPELLDYLTKDIAIAYNTAISTIEATTGGQRLYDTQGQNLGFFDHIIVATPPQVTIKLLKNFPITLMPYMKWSAVLKFSEIIYLQKDIIYPDNKFLEMAVRLTNMPGYRLNETGNDYWVLYSNSLYAHQQHLKEDTPNDYVLKGLFNCFRQAVNTKLPAPALLKLYAWPQYYPVDPLNKLYIEHPSALIIGDWVLGRRIEDALRSGYAAASRIREMA